MEDRIHMLATSFSIFQENTESPEIYTQTQEDKVEKFKTLTKSLYDSTWKDLRNFIVTKPNSLPNLITKGFDEEQVWQQLELQNNNVLPSFLKKLSNINSNDVTFDIDITNSCLDTTNNRGSPAKNKLSSRTINEYEGSCSKNGEYDFDDDSDSSVRQPSRFSESDEDESPRKKLENFTSKETFSEEDEDFAFDDDSDSSGSDEDKSLKKKLEALTSKEKFSEEKESYAFDDDDSDSSIIQRSKYSGSDEDKSLKKKLEAFTSKEKFSEETEAYAFDDDSDSSITESATISDKKVESFENKHKRGTSKKTYSTVVDDQFFQVSKLEEFLNLEDLKEERGKHHDSEEEIDLFEDIPSEEDGFSEDEEETDKKSSRNLMYEDFFDPPESGDESIKEKESIENEENRAENESDYDNEENIDDNAEINEDEHYELKKQPMEKTAFEIEQENVKKQIQNCEKLLLKPVPWQFTGEVEANKRPANSLLHQETEFDSNTKKDLVVDDTLTARTESIIKMAIINKAWNDVERKVKTTEEMIVQTKKVVIEQTKSKKGLAEVYEEDYLKKKEKQKEEEDPKHQAIKKLMDNLFPELHALFSHIPKPPVPEIKIVSNLPAVTVEDVAPITMSDAHLLAPQEVKKKTGLVKSKTERTDTDRKRERRKKKKLQKLMQMESEAKEKSGTKPLSAKARKKEKLETLKKLKRNKNTTIAEDNGQKIKSSKDFFSQLQDKVSAKVPGNTKEKKSKKVKLKHK